MTAVAPDIDMELELHEPPLVHWSCVDIEDHPFVALCGELLRGARGAGRVNCEECKILAPPHGQNCASCAGWIRLMGLNR